MSLPHRQPHFYFWESIECLRRLSLTGLLVFFADGRTLQTIVASLIALASLYMYSKYRPYRNVDALASMAQLMIFFQVSLPSSSTPNKMNMTLSVFVLSSLSHCSSKPG